MSQPPSRMPERGRPAAIAEQVAQLIYAGDFQPGERLNEAALALRMGTSRGPIREAIRILAGTGLVVPVLNRGVFVRQVSIREMLEIYELRALLFGFAAERAAEHVTDADGVRFESLLDRMDAASEAGDHGRYYELNLEFHRLVLALSQSRRAQRQDEEYVKELHLFRRQNFSRTGNMRKSNLEHRRLYEAIAGRQPAKARQQAVLHIEAGRQRLLKSLGDAAR